MNIAIDGPSGAGKSTIAKMLAKKLGFIYLDTGAMYRAVGLKAYQNKISADDEQNVVKILENTKISIVYENDLQKVFLDDVDVSEKIREHHISKYASDVSRFKDVREKLVQLQRKIAAKTDTVLDGRDIGTYVLPNAEYKFFLTASLDERANRRYLELISKGDECDRKQIKADIALRDYNDSNRDFAPLKQAEDSLLLDTTNLSIDEVCEKMLAIITG